MKNTVSDCLKFLRGMFAFAIWDERDKSAFSGKGQGRQEASVLLISSSNTFVFASEIKAILQDEFSEKSRLYGYPSLSYISGCAFALDRV